MIKVQRRVKNSKKKTLISATDEPVKTKKLENNDRRKTFKMFVILWKVISSI